MEGWGGIGDPSTPDRDRHHTRLGTRSRNLVSSSTIVPSISVPPKREGLVRHVRLGDGEPRPCSATPVVPETTCPRDGNLPRVHRPRSNPLCRRLSTYYPTPIRPPGPPRTPFPDIGSPKSLDRDLGSGRPQTPYSPFSSGVTVLGLRPHTRRRWHLRHHRMSLFGSDLQSL